MTAPAPSPPALLALGNRQRVRALDLRLLRRLARHLLEAHVRPVRFELAVHLVGTSEITRLNERFLGHAGPTDVITFDHAASAPGLAGARPSAGRRRPARAGTSPVGETGPPLWGEIFICLDEAVAQARRFRTTWQEEVVRYLIHGLLHLRGYDDHSPTARRAMKRAEDRLLRQLAARFPLRRLARGGGQRC